MGIVYNKQFTAKDRRIMTSGPADRQRKQRQGSAADSALIEELRSQIESLHKELANKPVTTSSQEPSEELFTAEQVNDEIVKAIKEETANLKTDYEARITKLNTDLEHAKTKIALYEKDLEYLKATHEKELAALQEILKGKDEMINQFKESKAAGFSEESVKKLLDEATKKLEETTLAAKGLSQADVDPNRPKMENSFIDPVEKESKVESHITVEDFSLNQKEEMSSKVNKLRNIMGKLPSKKG